MGEAALAQLSNNLVYSAMAVYLLAMLAAAGEVALGGSSGSGSSGARGSTGARRAASPAAVRAVGAGSLATAERVSLAPTAPPSRAERFGRVALSLTVLAFGLHLGAAVARGLSAGRVPWGNMYEFSLTGALAVTGAYLLLLRRYPVRFLGVVLVPMVLLILGLAVSVLYTESAQLVPALRSYWLVIHVSIAVLSSGLLTVGAALTVLYLLRSRAEQRDRVRGWLAQLPEADQLDRLAYRVHAFVFPLWTFTIIAGAIWAERSWGRYWGWDPKEVWSFVIFVVYAAYLHARATAGWRGRKAAYVALTGYACVGFNYLGINLLVSGLHSYAF